MTLTINRLGLNVKHEHVASITYNTKEVTVTTIHKGVLTRHIYDANEIVEASMDFPENDLHELSFNRTV